MNFLIRAFALFSICLTVQAQKISDLPVTTTVADTNVTIVVTAPNTVGGTKQITISNLFAGRTTGDASGTNSRQGGSLNLTNWSNIATGDMANIPAVTFLTNWANAVSNLIAASDITTSNGAVAFTMTSSNTLALLLEANDAVTSNALRTLLIANDTTTSNGAVAFTMAASNSLAVLTIAATNSMSVTGWINFRQLASQYLSNLVTAANGTGMLTNDGAGVLGWMTIPSGSGIANLSGLGTNANFYSTNLPNLVSGWTNNASFGYNTFTVSGANISSAVESGSFGIGYTSVSMVSGAVYRASFTLTLNSGAAPDLDFTTDLNAANPQMVYKSLAGTNRFYLKSSRTATEFLNWVNSANGNWSVAGFEFVLVTPAIDVTTLIVNDGFVSKGPVVLKGGASAMVNLSSEVFGQGASANTNQQATVFGYGADTGTANTYAGQAYGGKPTLFGFETFGGGTAFGYKARATNFEAVAVGPQSYAGGLATVAIGDSARALNINETVIGDVMWASGNANYLIGGGGAGTASNYIAAFAPLGGGVTYNVEIATAHNQGSFGWYNEANATFTNGVGAFNDWWLGGPLKARSPHAITLNITSMGAGNGSDSNGVNFTINGSAGTGTGVGGNIILATSIPGGVSSGVTNPLTATIIATGTNALFPKGIAVGPTPATITNTLFGATAIDFPSVLAGSFFDSPITVTGCTSNNCHVSLCVPWQAASGGGIFSHYSSNDTVYVRFANNNLTLAIDPTPATFSALVFKVQ